MCCFAQEVGWEAVELAFVGCLRLSERHNVRRTIKIVWWHHAGLLVGMHADHCHRKNILGVHGSCWDLYIPDETNVLRRLRNCARGAHAYSDRCGRGFAEGRYSVWFGCGRTVEFFATVSLLLAAAH